MIKDLWIVNEVATFDSVLLTPPYASDVRKIECIIMGKKI